MPNNSGGARGVWGPRGEGSWAVVPGGAGPWAEGSWAVVPWGAGPWGAGPGVQGPGLRGPGVRGPGLRCPGVRALGCGPASPKHTGNWTSSGEPAFALLFIFSLQLFCFVHLLKSLVIIMFSAFLTHS